MSFNLTRALGHPDQPLANSADLLTYIEQLERALRQADDEIKKAKDARDAWHHKADEQEARAKVAEQVETVVFADGTATDVASIGGGVALARRYPGAEVWRGSRHIWPTRSAVPAGEASDVAAAVTAGSRS